MVYEEIFSDQKLIAEIKKYARIKKLKKGDVLMSPGDAVVFMPIVEKGNLRIVRQNDDGKTVRAMDVLFPGIGEIIGGSQREERYDKLYQRMQEMHIPTEEMYWYLDTRKFGACPHAGFGLGFERLVLFVTGMTNIRDIIAFARTPKNCEF